MNKKREIRKISIDNKIFTKDNIISLIKLFIKRSNEILNKSKEAKREELIKKGWKESNFDEGGFECSSSCLEFTYSDRSTYTSSLDQNLDEDVIFSNKKIVEIDLNFSEHESDSRFRVRIKNSDSSSSYVSVEGQDSTWVNDTITCAGDFLSSCRNQSSFVRKYHISIIALTILTLVFFLLNLIELFIRFKLIFPKIVDSWFSKDLIYFIIILTLISATPAVYIYGWLNKLFPGIEIQIGKDFQHAEKWKRFKFWLIVSSVIIPTVISFLLRLL
jgi:hypothetical protein